MASASRQPALASAGHRWPSLTSGMNLKYYSMASAGQRWTTHFIEKEYLRYYSSASDGQRQQALANAGHRNLQEKILAIFILISQRWPVMASASKRWPSLASASYRNRISSITLVSQRSPAMTSDDQRWLAQFIEKRISATLLLSQRWPAITSAGQRLSQFICRKRMFAILLISWRCRVCNVMQWFAIQLKYYIMIVNDGQGNLKCLSLHIILHIATGPRSAYNSALSLILFGYYKQDCSAMHHFEPLHAANLMLLTATRQVKFMHHQSLGLTEL